jgi:hypothetical protein
MVKAHQARVTLKSLLWETSFFLSPIFRFGQSNLITRHFEWGYRNSRPRAPAAAELGRSAATPRLSAWQAAAGYSAPIALRPAAVIRKRRTSTGQSPATTTSRRTAASPV